MLMMTVFPPILRLFCLQPPGRWVKCCVCGLILVPIVLKIHSKTLIGQENKSRMQDTPPSPITSSTVKCVTCEGHA